MKAFYSDTDTTIRHADALDLLRSLDAGSVALTFLDPPYHRVKSELWWDNQWKTDRDFLDWIGQILDECKRVLAANGSLYVCASPKMAWSVQGEVAQRFNVLNSVRWYKDAGWHKKAEIEALRSWLEPWEAVVFAEQWGADGNALNESGYLSQSDKLRGHVFEPIRAYLAGEFVRAGVKFERANKFCSVASMAARHYFSQSQWCMPTEEHYRNLQRGLNAAVGNGSEYLRREYEDLRRPFFLSKDRPTTDLWTYEPVMPDGHKHPTAKPLQMLLDIIATSSRPGDLVADPFLGGGTTAVAARKLGRRFVGGDIQEHWCKATVARLKEAAGEMHLRPRRTAEQKTPEGQLSLL